MLPRAIRFGFLSAVLSLTFVASATAADVLDEPRALCDYFESLGMKTQFRWGPAPRDEAVYLSSADWMPRNMMRRVEVAWPIEDPAMRQRVIDEGLVPYLNDRVDAWELQADGQYVAAAGDGAAAQQALLQRWAGPAALPPGGGPGT